MKNKICIVTWHHHQNFGGNLQAYATSTVLTENGYPCELLTFKRDVPLISRLKMKIYRIGKFLLTGQLNQYNKFQFWYLKKTRAYSRKQLPKIGRKYKLFICGSDQIWAPNVFDSRYFLDFVAEGIPKIAYAPSIGLPNIPEELIEKYKILTSSFFALSVREGDGARLLSKITGKNVQTVLDPTLLLQPEKWDVICKKTKIDFPYVFCYILNKNHDYKNKIEEIKRILNVKTVVISMCGEDKAWADVFIEDAGPREFIGLIKNAEYVFTDSFHGLAFSIIYSKQVTSQLRFYDNDKICQNSRINNIVNKLGMESCVITRETTTIKKLSNIDYGKVKEKLDEQRKLSLSYLLNNVAKVLDNK